MARTAKINKEDVLKRLKRGETDGAIAEAVGCKWQYVQQLRLGFVREGLLDGKIRKKGRPRKDGHKIELELEPTIDIIIQGLEALKELPRVKAERDRYKASMKTAMEGWEAERRRNEKIEENKRRLKVAQQQGDMPRLTEHIHCATFNSPNLEPNRLAPDNIMDFTLEYRVYDDIMIDTLMRGQMDIDKERFNHKNCVLWKPDQGI